ncbi:hypothetical protein EN795_33805 [bacterium M00.F.Ca.ET.152.01.1.1]|nr:hypothetical protein EN795_33805 [bacterium M00.F.Ca.ET.152.01.1.1]
MRSRIDVSEIGKTAFFLASNAARHITGQRLSVCGNTEGKAEYVCKYLTQDNPDLCRNWFRSLYKPDARSPGRFSKGSGHRSRARRRRQLAEAREILVLAPASKNAQDLADALRV